MRTKLTVLAIVCLLLSYNSFGQKDVSAKSSEAIVNFKKTNDNIKQFFNTAYGYAIFPAVGKGGLGVGGATGNGTVYKDGYVLGNCKLTQITIGLQAGGQSYQEVIFFENKETFDRFTSNKFEFAAQVSAIALKAGVSLDAEYREGVIVITQAIGGLMYEASVGGQKFKTYMIY
tara:strand:+ start:2096 stop:2617 length:522 start_codon:yes stop_codon:yes gene_type:complete